MAHGSQHLKVLIVDRSWDEQEAYRRLLACGDDGRYEVVAVNTGGAALSRLRSYQPDCIVLDFDLPDMDGLEFLASLCGRESEPPAAVVMLSGHGDEKIAVEALKKGAHDYLAKSGVTRDSLLGAVQTAVENFGKRSRLTRLAFTDAVTGLANRNLFENRLGHAIAVAQRSRRSLALLLLDLNRFKSVNDAYGHHTGDAVLRELAIRLRRALRQADTVARVGGDEFAVILETGAMPDNALQVGERIVAAFSAPIGFNDARLELGVSVGIAICPDDASDADALMRRADTAMYRAKAMGRSCCAFFGIEAVDAVPRNGNGSAVTQH
jgi:diguanylate cyclase (GGDEF)-like protein